MSAARTELLLEALESAAAAPGPLLAWQRCLRELVGLVPVEAPGTPELARALCELRLVHRKEEVALLLSAAALRGSQDGAALAAWRARAREELRLAREDGFEAGYVLQECLLRPREQWRASAEIASAAEQLAREPLAAPEWDQARQGMGT